MPRREANTYETHSRLPLIGDDRLLVRKLDAAVYIPPIKPIINDSSPKAFGRHGKILPIDLSPMFPDLDDLEDHKGYIRGLNLEVPKLPVKDCANPRLFLGAMHSHYGHFLVESLTRVWALFDGQLDTNGLEFLSTDNNWSVTNSFWGNNNSISAYANSILSAAGVSATTIFHYDEPCIVTNVIVPAPSATVMSQMPYYVTRRLVESLRRIGSRLASYPTEVSNTPLYLSRASVLMPSVESVLEKTMALIAKDRGFRVVELESLPIETQVSIVASHKYIIGSIGSAFHTTLLVPSGKRLSVFENRHINDQSVRYFMELDCISDNSAVYDTLDQFKLSDGSYDIDKARQMMTVLTENLYR